MHRHTLAEVGSEMLFALPTGNMPLCLVSDRTTQFQLVCLLSCAVGNSTGFAAAPTNWNDQVALA